MQYLASLFLASLSLPFVHSFPTASKLAQLQPSQSELHDALIKLRSKRLIAEVGWTPIEVTGQHKFQAPDFSAGDQRGPCPGLNALANHGYLPRDGIASFGDIIAGVNEVYGMGVDLGTVLALMGTVWTGDPLSLDPSFSIGGESSKVNNIADNLLGLLGTPQGLAGSHNFIESDASFTRDDLYVTGDAATLDMSLFWAAYNGVDGDVITFEDVAATAAKRFNDSEATNPYFWYGPYTGMIARNAGYCFAARLLSNHSAEFPDGELTKEVFKSFWAIYDDASSPGGLVYKKGWEQIPPNWYKIPIDYSLLSLNLDLLQMFAQQPELLAIGGNTGTVNSFAGVDPSNLLGGVANLSTLLEGNNLICYALEVVKTFAPNSLSSLFKTLQTPLNMLSSAIATPLLDLACPTYSDLEAGGSNIFDDLLAKYPGAKKANSAL